ncbi:MAG: ATP-dependent DNA ligase [bacterium]
MKEFSEICEEIISVSSKLEKVKILSQYLQSLDGSDLHFACIYFTGSAFAAKDARKLNLGGQMIKKALALAVNMTSEEDFEIINQLSIKFSEAGELAKYVLETYSGKKEEKKSDSLFIQENKFKRSNFSITETEYFFNKIFETPGSIAKVNLLSDLYCILDPLSAKFVTKILAGDLRIGLKEASVEDAIASAFDEKSTLVKSSNMLIGDIGEVAEMAKRHELDNVKLTPFWPIKAMLATPAEDADEIIKRMGENLWVEDKYDGVRCQVHKFKNVIKLFSRDQNEITAQFPEIVNYVKEISHDIILDGEIMAFKNGEIMRFFFLQQRLGRKTFTEEFLQEIPVEYFVYDMIYLDGKELLTTTIRERRELLENILGNKKNKYNDSNYAGLHLSHKEEVVGAIELEKAFDAAKARVTEGLMVKKSDSAYKPGRRGIEWLKYKKAMEPLDVVITGVEYGNGKKRGLLSDYTFAVRDLESGELVNIGKAYSGVTDEQVRKLTDRFMKSTLEESGRFRTVVPEVVLEISFESIQKSNRYKSGYALRFPRITKIRIGDKGIDEINTIQDVAKMYTKYFEYESIPE